MLIHIKYLSDVGSDKKRSSEYELTLLDVANDPAAGNQGIQKALEAFLNRMPKNEVNTMRYHEFPAC